jgi:hypothetical protein
MRPTAIPLANIVPMLLSIQFAAFGWRVVREIGVGETHRRTWLPLADCLNLVMLAAVLFTCVINPVAYRANLLAIRTVVALAATARDAPHQYGCALPALQHEGAFNLQRAEP